MTPSTDQGETQGRGNRTFVAPGPWILTLGWAGGLVRKPSYRGESSVYSEGGKLSALEENAIFRIGTIEQLNRQFCQTSRPKG